MWKIRHIFDGDYGCEELAPGAKPMVSVTLINEAGEEKILSVEDEYLVSHQLDVGSEWVADRLHLFQAMGCSPRHNLSRDGKQG